MPPEFGIGYTGKGSVVLLSTFAKSDVGQARLATRAAYLWLAQHANHQPFSKALDGRAVTIDRGEWFGSHASLATALGVDKKTLGRILDELKALGAVEVRQIERPQRYRKGTVNGGETPPFNGGESHPQRWGNRTDVRCLGTVVKVLGWRDFGARGINGGKTPLQVVAIQPVQTPRLAARHQAVNAAAADSVRRGAL